MRAGPPLLREPERRPTADGHRPPEPPRARSASRLGSASMTIGSSMSSGYCSLDEDLEDCFFTAKTSFFRSAANKVSAKVTAEKLVRRAAKGGGGGVGVGVPVFPHVWLQVLPELASSRSQGRAAAGRKALPLPGSPLPLRGAALLQICCCCTSPPFARRVHPFLGVLGGAADSTHAFSAFGVQAAAQLPARGPAAGQGPVV